MGLFSSSNSASSTTNNYDQRVVADGGGVGLSGNNSTFNVLDGGITSRAMDSLDTNFKLVQDGAGAGLSALTGLAERMFNKSSETATAMAAGVNASVLDAYSNATTDAKGTIDNKTIVTLAIAAAVVVGFVYMRRAK